MDRPADFPDDAGTDYLITHPDWDRHAYLASLDGHYSGPGLSWSELVAVTESAPAGAEGVVDPGLRLLLPAFGDADVPEAEALARTSEELWAVGVSEEALPEVAERLLDHVFRDGPGDPAGGCGAAARSAAARPGPAARWHCATGSTSPRGVPAGLGITAEQERALADALAGRPEADQPVPAR